MELAATVVPVLFVALVLERRAAVGLDDFLRGGAATISRWLDAVVVLATTTVLIAAEWVALESVRRGHSTEADDRAVMAILGIGAVLLSLPIVARLALELAGPRASNGKRLRYAGTLLGLGAAAAVGLFELAT